MESELPVVLEPAPASVDWLGAVSRVAEWGVSILNGFLGDYMAHKEMPLAMPMRVYNRRAELSLGDGQELQLEAAGGTLCILIHGLACNEYAWSFFNEENNDYGSLLEQDLGYTPLYLRYNSGKHVSHNGRELAQLISKLCRAWPVEIEQIVLIGHSLGGLVARSACHYGLLDGASWCKKVSRIFLLGAPNLGAPLEKFAEVLSQSLKQVKSPYTYLAAGILELRSCGIKDLRYGYLVDEEWQHSPDRPLQNNRVPVPLLPGAAHYVLAGTLNHDVEHPVTRWFGDSLVRVPSATGRARRQERSIPFPSQNCRVFAALNHYDLVWHPEVYEQIRSWCESDLLLSAPV